MKTKTVAPNATHAAYVDDLKAVMQKHAEALTAQELLALTSQLVGQILAFQDQRTMTPQMGLEIIGRNIEIGNDMAVGMLRNGVPLNGRPV